MKDNTMKDNTMKNTKNIKRTGTLGVTEEPPKPAAVVTARRVVKHYLTAEDREVLQDNLLAALEYEKNAEAQFASVKATHKSNMESASSTVTRASSALRAGWDTREEELEVVFRVEDGEKDFYLPGGGEKMLTEKMVESDYVQELPGVEKP